jgi:hypothetical protein
MMVLEWDYPINTETPRDSITLFWDLDVLMEYFAHPNPSQFSYQKTVEKIKRQKKKHPKKDKGHSSGQAKKDGGQMRLFG